MLSERPEVRLILGPGHSGTTWLSYVLSKTPTPIRFFMEGLYQIDRSGHSENLSLSSVYDLFLAERTLDELAHQKLRDDADWKFCLIKEVHRLSETRTLLNRPSLKAILLTRDPVRIVDSLLIRGELKLGETRKEQIDGILARVIAIAKINTLLKALAEEFDNARLVTYESLCRQPHTNFKSAAEFLDLAWSDEMESLLVDTTTGQHRRGIKFSIFRDTTSMLARPLRFMTPDEAEVCYKLLQGEGNL